MQRVSILVLALVLMLFGVVNAQANVAIVIVGGQGLTFSPQTIDINAGDTVTFLNFGGVHNVVADDGSFRCAHGCDNDGNGGNGAATGQLWLVSIDFPNAGTVGYFCETHGTPGTGMFGTINVLGAAPPPSATRKRGIDRRKVVSCTARRRTDRVRGAVVAPRTQGGCGVGIESG